MGYAVYSLEARLVYSVRSTLWTPYSARFRWSSGERQVSLPTTSFVIDPAFIYGRMYGCDYAHVAS